MNWLRKTTVGRRCDQKTLPQRFLAQPDSQHGLRLCATVAAQFSSSLSAPISVNKWFQKDRSFPFCFSLCVLRDLRVQNLNPRSSAHSAGKNLTSRCFGHKYANTNAQTLKKAGNQNRQF
jgi:hypothetical protein